MKPIRILLADDHALVRAGFRALLQNLGMEVVGEASDGREALRLIGTAQPDIVLMDIAMAELNGLEATAQIVRDHPAVRIIIVSMHANAEYVRRAIRFGAAGYLLKGANPSEFELAIKSVARGEKYLSPPIAKHVLADYSRAVSQEVDELDGLTTRQREILQLLAEGYARQEIAQKLCISVKTFDTYRAQLLDRLQIEDVAGLVRYAARVGLVQLEN